jgi:hypothetical protein
MTSVSRTVVSSGGMMIGEDVASSGRRLRHVL